MLRRAFPLWLVALFFAACMTACSSNGAVPAPGGAAGSGGTTGGGGGASVTGFKQPLLGLIDMQDISWHDTEGGEPTFTLANISQFTPGTFGGIVINATWDKMQPTQNGQLVTSQIDTALAAVQAYNTQNPAHQLGAKLRIYSSSSAPLWVQQLGGATPIPIQRNPGGCSSGNCPLTIGKFWDPSYIAAWQTFQAMVAAKYDSNPIVRAVAVTSCTSQTDEPFVPTTDKTSKANLIAAGYTDGAYQSCLSGAPADYKAWKTTLVDYSFNTFVSMQVGGTNPAFTANTMAACRNSLGAQCVLDNHDLMEPTNPNDSIVYSTMPTLSGPINFQTQAPRGMGCQWTATIARGIQLGASAIEIWPAFQGFTTLTSPNMISLASLFTNPIAVPAVPNPLPTANCVGFNPPS
jgi:hypothetical protein